MLEYGVAFAYIDHAMTLSIAASLMFLLARPGVGEPPPDEFDQAFTSAGVVGTCIVYDLAGGTYTGHRPARWDSAYIPASTFKIPNSLIALETGVIADVHTVIRWDSVPRSFAAWNQDHTMASAFKASVVWFYQELARRIGAQRMQHYLDTTGYGNRTMGGAIDEFWLNGELRITPRQQVEFLVRLYRGTLPFTPATMAAVREIMVQERTDRYVLRAKTGWSDAGTPGVGWYVGYIERGSRVVFFATEIEMNDIKEAPARAKVTREILKQLQLID